MSDIIKAGLKKRSRRTAKSSSIDIQTSTKKSKSRSRGRKCASGTFLKMDESGNFYCEVGENDKLRREIEKAQARAKGIRKKREGEYEHVDLVRPYMVNPMQANLLAKIIGTKGVDEMRHKAALVYSGILNNDCNSREEAYIHPITGKRQCRVSARPVLQYNGVTQCPEKVGEKIVGDPFAIEHYVDAFGTGRCRRPVLQGAFTCPFNMASSAFLEGDLDKAKAFDIRFTKHITLPDGTGLCVQEREDLDSEFLMPHHIVYPSQIYKKVKEYLSMFENNHLDLIGFSELYRILEKAKDARGLISSSRGTIESGFLADLIKRIVNDGEIPALKHAAFQYGAIHYPEFFSGKLGTTKADFLKFFGINPSNIMAYSSGGKKHRKHHRKNAKKKRSTRKKTKSSTLQF